MQRRMKERTWKEAVVVNCNVLSQHLPIGTEENHEKPQDIKMDRKVWTGLMPQDNDRWRAFEFT
jgi:hypothetical protein